MPALAQEAPSDLEARARALVEERLGALLDSVGRPAAASLPEGVRFAVRFEGNVQGLVAGAPVTIRGLRVGTVREITVTFDSATGALDVPVVIDVVPATKGVVRSIETRRVGLAVVVLGGGRTRPQDDVDHAVGLTGLAAVGDTVDASRPLATVHARTRAIAETAAAEIHAAYRVGRGAVDGRPVVAERVAPRRPRR